MWPKLQKQIEIELEILDQLLADHSSLMEKCAETIPNRIELSALAAMLHGFYNGIENIFKRIAIELNEGLPEGSAWHKELLLKMSQPGSNRPPAISPDLAEKIKEHLEFRHFFRSAYSFQLRWNSMAHLVQNCGTVLEQLEAELDSFLTSVETNKFGGR